MGDLNARVGRDHTVWQGVLGRHGVGNCNANERMLLELCSEQGLIITNSLFQQIAKFKTIWQHPRSWNTGTSWTTSSCARRTSVTCYIPESWPVLTATQTTGLQRGKEGYRCSKPTGCWWGKFSSRKSSSPDKKRRNCQYGKQIPSTMLREVKEELSEGIYIGFRTDGSVLNLRRLLARKRDDRGADPWTAHTVCVCKQWLTTSQGLLKHSVWPSAWRRQRSRFTKIPHSRCIAHPRSPSTATYLHTLAV